MWGAAMNSRFYNFHPASLTVYFASVLWVAMFCQNPVFQAFALVGGGTFLAILKGGKKLFSDLAFYVSLFVLIAVTNPIFSHNGATPLFFMNGNPVTAEAVFCGASIAATLISVILWFGSVTRIMSDEKIVYLFGKPFPKLALVLSMALRFVPRLKERFAETENAQKALGLFSVESRFDRLKFKLAVFFSTVSQAAESSVEISQSMRGRGYGLKNRTSFSRFKFTAADAVIGAASLAASAVIIFGKILGKTDFGFYPVMSEIPVNAAALASYGAYAALSFAPSIIELTESIKWKFFISKI